MVYVKLRAHHVSRIIDHHQGYTGLRKALEIYGCYSNETIDRVTDLVDLLINDSASVIEIISNDEVADDSICSLCDIRWKMRIVTWDSYYRRQKY